MSTSFDDLREDFARGFEAIEAQGETTTRAIASIFEEQRKLWADNAALRDELHAVANRVESLTRAQLTEPAEVAEAMVAKRHEAASPMYREERNRYLIECECGWEYEGRSREDANAAHDAHLAWARSANA